MKANLLRSYIYKSIYILAILYISLTILSYRRFVHDNHISIIIFKVPRSGSSWLAEILNNVHNVYISKEIVQGKDKGKFSTAVIENYLIEALKYPKDKINYANRWIPSGRFISDFILKFKFSKKLDVIGFTINPKHVEGVQWDRVVRSVKHVKVVFLLRTNLIKMAFSEHLGKLTKSQCKSSNYKSKSSCRISTSNITWHKEDFLFDLLVSQERNRLLSDLKISLMNIESSYMYYEDLQMNPRLAIQNLFKEPDVKLYDSESHSEYLTKIFSNKWVKRANEDLRSHIANFNDLSTMLASQAGCRCYYNSLLAYTIQKVTSLCPKITVTTASALNNNYSHSHNGICII